MISRGLFFILILGLLQSAFAADDGRFEVAETGETYWLTDSLPYGIFNDFKSELSALKANPLDVTQAEQCNAGYSKLFKSSDLRWSIFFGYGDGDGNHYTTDMAERDLFVKEIKTPCQVSQSEIKLCDFKEVSAQSGEYVKTLVTKDSRTITLHLRLYNASLTSEIAKNNQFVADQKKKSKEIENAYIEALKNDDIVFYSGHSRYGTGPGFRPMIKNSFVWWSAALFRPMANKVYKTLSPYHVEHGKIVHDKPPEKLPSVMGFFACEAEAHYGAELASSVDAGLIMTRQSISTQDNMRLLYAASNSLLNQSCEADFQQNMKQAIKTVFYNPKKESTASVDESKFPKFFNFFHTDKLKNKNSILMYYRNQNEVGKDIEPDINNQ